MSVVITCGCGDEFQASEEYALAQCPACGRDLLVPPPDASRFPLPKTFYLVDDEFDGPGWNGDDVQLSGRALASVLLALIATVCAPSIVLGPLLGIPAVILGCRALIDIRTSWGHRNGGFLAGAGIVLGSLATLVIPALMIFAGGYESREASRRSQCVNNLKQIGLAMHNYYGRVGHFPGPAITDANGRPLLSWRVALLPDVEARSLYLKFRLDEPWDSPHNKALLKEIPSVYVCPSDPTPGRGAATMTRYQAFVGPRAAFEHAKNFVVSDIHDGTSKTLLVSEARNLVPWTKPCDLPFNPNGELPPLDSHHKRGVNALFADGSVRFLRHSESDSILRSLITRSGGEFVAGE